MKYDFAVIVGGFRPVHNGHLKIFRKALKESKNLIIVVGSANIARNTRIPFTVHERIEMLEVLCKSEGINPYIVSANDYPYDDNLWNAGIRSAVDSALSLHAAKNSTAIKNPKIALVGMNKDNSSYYLHNFPEWSKSIDVDPEFHGEDIISSTKIREWIFTDIPEYSKKYMTDEVYAAMMKIIKRNPEVWDNLKYEYKYELNYPALWGHGPHVTVDALVLQAGHILLIQRGKDYGYKKFALPGGFLNVGEKIEDGMLRELREETVLKVPEKVLRGCIQEVQVFDAPHRSRRARIITHVHKIVLTNDPNGLPKIKGSDDAMKAMWIPISELKKMEDQFFEDHFEILRVMGVV